MSNPFACAANLVVSLLVALAALLTFAGTPAHAAGNVGIAPLALPTMSIGDVTISEGDSGTKFAVFTVSLSSPATSDVNFDVATVEGNAIGNDDFEHYYSSGRTISAGESSATLYLVIFGDNVVEPDETFLVTLANVTNATLVDGEALGTIVNDDSGASPALLIGDVSISEGNSGTKTANFTVQLSKAAASAVSFNIATANGSATAGSDYTALNLSNQSIPAGQIGKSFSVTINGDTTTEADETFMVNLSNVSGAGVNRGQAIGSIVNDDNVSAVKMSVRDVRFITEGNSGTDIAIFTVQLSKAAVSTVTFDIATSDSTATAGSDYVANALTGQRIPAGQTTKTFTVTVNGDTTPESEERFIVSVSNAVNAAIEDAHAVGTILNDDATMSIGDVSILEGTGSSTAMSFPVTLSAPLSLQVMFQVDTIDGTATAASGDYNGQSQSNWTIPSGQTSANVIVWVGADTALEADETFKVRISGGGAPITDNEGVGTILNDDAPPVPSLYVNSASVSEGNSGTKVLDFLITMSEAALGPVSFDICTVAGSAQAGVDYVQVAPGRFTIPAGQTSGTFSVTINGDTAIEYDETFAVEAQNISGGTFANNIGNGTILNDDFPVVPTVSIGDVTVTETEIDQQVVLPIILSAPPTNALNFYVFTRDGTALQSSDYGQAIYPVYIPAGATSGTVSVTVKGDTLGEVTESFEVWIDDPWPNGTLGDRTAVVTIIDNDGAPAPNLSINDVAVTEGDTGTTMATFTVSLSAAATTPVTFDVVTADEWAQAPSDYTALALTGLTIGVGQTSTSVSVAINGDTVIEDNESFSVQVRNVAGANPTDVNASGTILNDDPTALPTLSISDVSLTEGNSGTKPAIFTVSLSKPAATQVSVILTSADMSATGGSDFAPVSMQLFISAGQTSETFSVDINGDTVVEPDETFQIGMHDATGATILDSSGLATIVNDDSGGSTPTLSIGDVSISEGDSLTKQATFTVTLSAAASAAVTYDIATANGTAVSGSDYVAKTLSGQSIPAGTLSKTFTVAIKGDTVAEPDETFLVNVSSVVGATLADGHAVGTITNDDSGSTTPSLSIGDVSISEGNSGTKVATFTVGLSGTSSSAVTYNIATADGSATAGSDYVASSLSNETIAAGSTSKTFAVTIKGDTATEGNETFTVNVSSVVGATVADGSATGTISNDDSAGGPTLSIGDVSISEGNSLSKQATFTVTLSAAASTAVTYNIATANGTATSGSDYVASSLSGQTIAAGATSKTFAVTISGDTATESNETFAVTLSNVSGATLGDGSAIGTITNDDGGSTPTLSIGDVSISEGNSLSKQATFTIRLSVAASGPVTYNIATANRTAVSGTDYTAKSLTGQSIPAGSTSKTFNVAVKGDTVVEPNETFTVNVSSVVGASVADGQATGTITNDDAAALSVSRLLTGGLYDDIDDGNGAPQLSTNEYALMLTDEARQVCAHAGGPTIVGVDGVENLAVLSDLAEAANALCARKPHYGAVLPPTEGSDQVGFLVELDSTDGASVESVHLLAPPVDMRNARKPAVLIRAPALVTLVLPGNSGAESLSVMLVPGSSGSKQARAKAQTEIATRVRAHVSANPRERLVVLGGTGSNQLDARLHELGVDPSKQIRTQILVSPALLQDYPAASVSPTLPAFPDAEKVLQLRR